MPDILAPSSTAVPGEKEPTETRKKWQAWLDRVDARMRYFENGWWKQAKNAERMYDIRPKVQNQTDDEQSFNVLYANTEVLLPSLYSASPRPDVSPRNKSAPVLNAQAAEAFLTTVIDMNIPGRESFDESMEQATLSALVPGMGFVRVRAYPGQVCPIRTEGGNYREMVWGRAPKWARVPWVAFIHTMVKEDIVSQFELSEEQEKKLSIPTQSDTDLSQNKKGPDEPVYVFELWIRKTKQVVWLCAAYEDLLLEEGEDTLKLASFYPTPGPLALVKKSNTIDPTPLYEYYRSQATELNRVTTRLNKVLSAIKVRGAYNQLLGDDLKTILAENQMENGLVASKTPMDLMGRGFEGHIWFLPLDQLITVASQLYQARVQIMSVIQQITGLSDIVRGSTVASETATAQDLKNKWGTIRLRRMQRTVAIYVRDILRLAINAAATVLSEEEWKGLTQLSIPTSKEKASAMQQLQVLAQQAAMQQQMAQMQGQVPGAPPPQPPAPPDPKLMSIAQSPSWADIMSVLKSDGGRAYSIDVETASTVDTDATADREEVGEFMVSMGQLLAGLAPLAQLGPSGMEVSKQLLIAVCSKFKFGREVKESLEKLKIPTSQGQGPDPKVQAELQVAQAEAAAEMQKIQLLTQQKQQEHELKMQEMAQKQQILQQQFEHDQMQIASQKQSLIHQTEVSALKLAVAKKTASDRLKATSPAKSRGTS